MGEGILTSEAISGQRSANSDQPSASSDPRSAINGSL